MVASTTDSVGAAADKPTETASEIPLSTRLPRLRQSLDIMEKAILVAPYGDKQCQFRTTPVGIHASSPSPGTPTCETLWTFQGESGGVTCVSCSKSNPNLIAAGYGVIGTSLGSCANGSILIWTLNNPVHYTKKILLPYTPLSLDFSKSHPFMLAVSLYDGSVCSVNTS